MKYGREGVCFLLGVGAALVATSYFTESHDSSEVEISEKTEQIRPKFGGQRQQLAIKENTIVALDSKVYQKLKNPFFKEKEQLLEGLSDNALDSTLADLEKKTTILGGLEFNDRLAFEAVLNERARRNFEGTLEWIQGRYTGADEESLLLGVIVSHFEDAPDAGIKFASSLLPEERLSSYANKLLRDTPNLTTELAEVCYDHAVSSRTSVSVSFHPDFDFGSLGRRAVMHVEKAKQNKQHSYPTLPVNFFNEWARRDVHAAYDFYEEVWSEAAPHRDVFPNIVEGFSAQATATETVEWVGSILEEGALNQWQRAKLIKGLVSGKYGGNHVYVNVLESSADRSRLLVDSHRSFNGHMQEPAEEAAVLSLFRSPEERVAAFEDFFLNHEETVYNYSEGGIERLEKQLRELGHTDADIERIKTARNR